VGLPATPKWQRMPDLQKTLQKQPHFSHLGQLIHIRHCLQIDAQCPIIMNLMQLIDQPAILNLALADAHLQLIFRRIAKPHMIDVL
jgi:hypothetical protein